MHKSYWTIFQLSFLSVRHHLLQLEAPIGCISNTSLTCTSKSSFELIGSILAKSWKAIESAHNILQCSTRRATKIVQDWEIKIAKSYQLLKTQRKQQLVALHFCLQASLHDHAIQLEIQRLKYLTNDDDLNATRMAQQRFHAQYMAPRWQKVL